MIKGIGIDIVQINRMESWIANNELLNRYFHSDELSLSSNRKTSASQTLAARFAAKEAFGKALGTGLANITLKDIIILNKDNGEPQIILKDTALEAFKKSGAEKIHISLSHERENAVAIIVLEA